MADAMPDHTDTSEEPRRHPDSESELLSFEDEEDEAGVIADADDLILDDEDAASSEEQQGHQETHQQSVSSDNAPQSPDQHIDSAPASPDQHVDSTPASPDQHKDTEQLSEPVFSEAGTQESLPVAYDQEDADNLEDQDVSSGSEAGLLDDSLEDQQALGDEAENSEAPNDGQQVLNAEDEGGVVDKSEHEDVSHSRDGPAEGPHSPDAVSEEALEGPQSPDQESDEGQCSPAMSSGSASEDEGLEQCMDNNNTNVGEPEDADAFDDNNQVTKEGPHRDLVQNKAMQDPASPDQDQDMQSPGINQDLSSVDQTSDDIAPSVSRKESESMVFSTDDTENHRRENFEEASDEEMGAAENEEGHVSSDDGELPEPYSPGTDLSDSELGNNTESSLKDKSDVENVSDYVSKTVNKEEKTTVAQTTAKKVLSDRDSRSDGDLLSQKAATLDNNSHRKNEARFTDSAPRVSASKSGLHDDHGELDYYEDVDDVHMDCHKKSDGDADQSGEAGKDQEEGAIDSHDADEGEIEDDEDEEAEEDGELDDEDCEEGEIKEPDGRKPFVPPVCRFYNRGHCTWGQNCRFLHPGVNDKGNYSLIEPPGQMLSGKGSLHSRLGPWGRQSEREPAVYENELPPPPVEEPVVETAWERGLRHAKELMKKANKRKETDTNFEEKKMNLPLEEDHDQNKENDFRRYPKDPYYDQQGYEEEEMLENTTSNPLQSWHQGHYENFEVRWTRDGDFPAQTHAPPPNAYREREREPARMRDARDMMDPRDNNHYRSPERFGRKPHQRHHHHHHRPRRHDRHDRPHEPPQSPIKSSIREERSEKTNNAPRVRSDEWRDPWRRSKSPKIRRGSFSRSRSRGRRRKRSYSRGSYSSSSSSSRSSRSRSSSYSSYSSRSSYSRSSSYSSRSRSRSKSPRPSGATKKSAGPPPSAGIGSQKKLPPKPGEPPANALSAKGRNKSPVKRKTAPVSNDKAPVGPGRGIPKTMSATTIERGRKMERGAPSAPKRGRRRASMGSSSGSSLSRSRSHSSSSSRSRSDSASSKSSGSSSWSSSSSGSADSANLYRDIAGPNRAHNSKQPVSPKKKPSKPGAPMPAGTDKISKERTRKEEPKRPPRQEKERPGDSKNNADRDKAKDKKAPKLPQKPLLPSPTKQPSAPTRQPAVPPSKQQNQPSSRQPNTQSAPPSRPSAPPPPRLPPVGPVRAAPPPSAKSESTKIPKNQVEKAAPGVDSRVKSTVAPSKSKDPLKLSGKDPLKLSGQKPSIKLTLLNKPQEKSSQNSHSAAGSKKRVAEVSTSPPPAKRQAKSAEPPKPAPEKERKGVKLTLNKPDKPPARPPVQSVKNKPEDKPAKAALPAVIKKPESQPQKAPSKPAAPPAAAKPKKSTSSRREELLKQLKAVEDAIARKRAKLN